MVPKSTVHALEHTGDEDMTEQDETGPAPMDTTVYRVRYDSEGTAHLVTDGDTCSIAAPAVCKTATTVASENLPHLVPPRLRCSSCWGMVRMTAVKALMDTVDEQCNGNELGVMLLPQTLDEKERSAIHDVLRSRDAIRVLGVVPFSDLPSAMDEINGALTTVLRAYGVGDRMTAADFTADGGS